MVHDLTQLVAGRAAHALLHQLTPAIASRAWAILAQSVTLACDATHPAAEQPHTMQLLQHSQSSCLVTAQQHPQFPAALQRQPCPLLVMQHMRNQQSAATLCTHRTQRRCLHSTAIHAAATDGSAHDRQYHQPTAQEAAAPPIDLPVAEFSDDWINRVGLTGKVVKGPQLFHFEKFNKYKAVMVLSLFNRVTGDPFADAPRAFLVEAWDAQALQLHRTVAPDSFIYVAGHLACDHRREAQNKLYGPALSIRADVWELISPDTIPPGRHVYEYRGEFDAAFSYPRPRSSQSSAAPSTPSGGSRRRLSAPSLPPDWTANALQMLKDGQQLTTIAAELQRNPVTVWEGVMKVAGDSRDDWAPLLRAVGLTAEQNLDPCEVYGAVSEAMTNNTEPLTKEGQVRKKAIREYLLTKQTRIADAIRQQEAMADGKQDVTFRQLQLLQKMRNQFGHPSQLSQQAN